MTSLSTSSFLEVQAFRKRAKETATTVGSLEELAQSVALDLHRSFALDVVLSRMYAVLPYALLSSFHKDFVQRKFAAQLQDHKLNDDTRVLTLLGSAGVEKEWCEPRKSNGHLAIPLLSSEFVSGIPMVSRLLHDLGLPMEWIDKRDTITASATSVQTRMLERISGCFYVKEAATAKDEQGRFIIPARDFVKQNEVQTVFGAGGQYLTQDIVLTLIVFCRQQVERHIAERFIVFPPELTAATATMVAVGSIFKN
jgi:hypothetical protein